MATNGKDDPTTDDLVEGTRRAREAAEAEVQAAHDDAARLEHELEEEGLTPDADADGDEG